MAAAQWLRIRRRIRGGRAVRRFNRLLLRDGPIALAVARPCRDNHERHEPSPRENVPASGACDVQQFHRGRSIEPNQASAVERLDRDRLRSSRSGAVFDSGRCRAHSKLYASGDPGRLLRPLRHDLTLIEIAAGRKPQCCGAMSITSEMTPTRFARSEHLEYRYDQALSLAG